MTETGCQPAAAGVALRQAGGAWRTYIKTPLAARHFAATSPKRATTFAEARQAVTYMTFRLRLAAKSLTGCPTTSKPLASVIVQQSAAVAAVGKDIKAGKIVAARITAVDTLGSAVTSQATRVGYLLDDIVPTTSDLAKPTAVTGTP